MKKAICLIIALALLMCSFPALGAIYETYPGTLVPKIERYTNAIYMGILCKEKGGVLLYKIGTDDLSGFLTVMTEQGYTTHQEENTYYFTKPYTSNQDASLTYLPDSDEYALSLPSIYSVNYSSLLFSSVLDPSTLFAYSALLKSNSSQNTYYYSILTDNIPTYIASMENKGYTVIYEGENEWIMRGGTEAVSIKTVGSGRYSSVIMALSIVQIKTATSDEAIIESVLAQSELTSVFYEGNRAAIDTQLNLNSVYILKLYASGGRCAYITADRLADYKAVGWYETEEEMTRTGSVKLYSIDGRTIYVSEAQVAEYLTLGWDTLPPVTVYSADGRELEIFQKDIEAYIAVGWYETLEEAIPEKTVELYSVDGRTLMVSPDEVDSYVAVGWYTAPMVEMCPADADDERVIFVPEEEVEAYINVGWVRK